MGFLLHCEAYRIRGCICLDDIIGGVRAAFCALELCWTDRDAVLRFVGTVSVKPLQLLARNKAANTRRQLIVGILMRRRLFALLVLRAAAFVMVRFGSGGAE